MPNVPTTSPTATHSPSGRDELARGWSAGLLGRLDRALIDLQPHVALTLQRAGGAHERAHSLGDAALAADDLAQVIAIDLEAKHGGVAVVAHHAYLDGVGLVHQVARDELDQSLHVMRSVPPDARSLTLGSGCPGQRAARGMHEGPATSWERATSSTQPAWRQRARTERRPAWAAARRCRSG